MAGSHERSANKIPRTIECHLHPSENAKSQLQLLQTPQFFIVKDRGLIDESVCMYVCIYNSRLFVKHQTTFL